MEKITDEFFFVMGAKPKRQQYVNGFIIAAKGERAELELSENGRHIDDHLPTADLSGLEMGVYVWSGQITYGSSEDTDIFYNGFIAPATEADYQRFGIPLPTKA